MASIRTRTGRRGTTYQVLFREDGRQSSESFADATSAQQFVDLIGRRGITGARLELAVRRTASSQLVIRVGGDVLYAGPLVRLEVDLSE